MRFASRDIYIRNGSERLNTECSLAPFGHYFVSSTTSIHHEGWKIRAVCARIQLLEFKMPKLFFEQMWNTCWIWKQAVGWITELCGPVSPAIRASTGTVPCSGYPGTQPTSRQLLWEQRKRSWLKDKTGANSKHRLKMYLWGIQFNRFGKQTKWYDLQRLQRGTSKTYKPQNKWEEIPNFCPGPIADFLMIYPWHWSRRFIYCPVLKLCILLFFISDPCIQNIWSTVLLAQHRNHFLVTSPYRWSFLYLFQGQWCIRVRSHISKSTGLILQVRLSESIL